MGIPLDLSGYTLTYDDEFNAFQWSADGSVGYKTTFYFGGRELYSNGDLQYYSDASVGVDPFSLSDGALHITASPGANPDNQPYNSGMITTEGSFSQTYGYFEARIQVAEGPGMWSAFWMLPTDKSWPPEIDPLEAFGAPNPGGDGGQGKAYHGMISADRSESGGGWAPVDGDIYASYHTYGVDWQPDHLTYYIDGQQVFEVGQLPTPVTMNKPMYMILDLAVGGWPGNPAGETSVMSIDYLRAYSKAPDAQAVALQTISSPDGVDTTPFGAMDANGAVAAPDRIVVRVAADAWNGSPQFTVSVDGQQIGGVQTATAAHAAGQWQDITLAAALGPGNHAIAIDYINDANGGTADANRNLYVQSVSVNGEVLPGTEAQNTAANGQSDPDAAVMDVNGTATFTAVHSTVTVRASEDAFNGDAKFIVLVDGNQLGGVQTVTASHAAGQWQDITLDGYFQDAHTVAVSFLNDAWGGSASTDRNMYVQSVTVNGHTLPGTAAANDAANGATDPDAAVLAVNGTATFTDGSIAPPDPGTGTDPGAGTGGTGGSASGPITVRVSEDAWNGDAHFTVTVDGVQFGGVQTVTGSHAAGDWQDIAIAGTLSTGAHTIGVNFLNDAWGGSASTDRNMYVQSITVNGETLQGTSAQNTAANGESGLDPSAAVMAINGTATFHSIGSGTVQPSTIVFHVSEDAWNGDAQFQVLVDGAQVGGIQTVTASHAAHQVQDIALTGDFGMQGPGQIDVVFLNDAWGGSADTDRNLYVQSIDVNGVGFAGNAAVNNAANHQEASDPSAAVMAIDGTASFLIHHTAPPEIMG
jgi:beta-glucanase (GH16 family)